MTTKPLPPDWVWIRVAATEYGVSYRTLMRWCDSGLLTKHRRMGDQRVYLRREEVEAKLELHPTPSPHSGVSPPGQGSE